MNDNKSLMITDKPEQKERKPQEMLKGFLGKEVILSLKSGTKLKGKLEAITTYDLIISVSYKPVVVLKHGIEYVELAGQG